MQANSTKGAKQAAEPNANFANTSEFHTLFWSPVGWLSQGQMPEKKSRSDLWVFLFLLAPPAAQSTPTRPLLLPFTNKHYSSSDSGLNLLSTRTNAAVAKKAVAASSQVNA